MHLLLVRGTLDSGLEETRGDASRLASPASPASPTSPAHRTALPPPSPASAHAPDATIDPYTLVELDDSRAPLHSQVYSGSQLPAVVRELETQEPRWIFERTASVYPQLLVQNVRVQRCHDLALSHSILAMSSYTQGTDYPREVVHPDAEPPPEDRQETLFAQQPTAKPRASPVSRYQRQLAAVRSSTHPGRLALLLAAESAAALLAAEMQHTGVPWDTAVHDALLVDALGPRPPGQQRPANMQALAEQIAQQLNTPGLNPDSPQELLRALHRAGIEAKSTRSWELERINHPVMPALLEYKKLARLHSANGWYWLDTWIADGRFRPEYVVAGVPSGRWASRGGGALQIPKQVRSAVRALPGRKLVVVDAAQLEPRVLVALAQDSAMAEAATGHDLYAGIAQAGFGGERALAKRGLLGAMYGATQGESGQLMLQLRKLYPRAMALVDEAARAGERGEIVTTYLGRSCAPPSDAWRQAMQSTTAEQQRAADAAARSRGRFTRNFVVQGSAAEWAECWLAQIRQRLNSRPELEAEMVFFLHDEVVVHCPEQHATEVAELISECAETAKELIFGQIPVTFPVTAAVVDRYDQAK